MSAKRPPRPSADAAVPAAPDPEAAATAKVHRREAAQDRGAPSGPAGATGAPVSSEESPARVGGSSEPGLGDDRAPGMPTALVRSAASDAQVVAAREVIDASEAEVVEPELEAEAEVEALAPEEDDVLAEVSPVTDEELDAIAKDLRLRTREAPVGSTALAVRDPMAVYMSEVRKHPLLTREEEHELAVAWVEHGDREAGRRLVTANLRLVVKLANEYRRGYHNLLDLVQEGNVGLVRAVEKFDPYRGVKLSTYAGWWIRAYILKYILNNWSVVKIGTTQTQRKLFFNLRKAQERLRAAGVEATSEQLARELDVGEEDVVEMQKRMAGRDSSLDAPVGNDEGSTRTRLDSLGDDAQEDPETSMGGSELKELLFDRLRRFGATLEGRDLELFRERVIADEPLTLQDFGERWGVSRERARQVEKRLVLKLRAYLQQELGDTVDVALGHD